MAENDNARRKRPFKPPVLAIFPVGSGITSLRSLSSLLRRFDASAAVYVGCCDSGEGLVGPRTDLAEPWLCAVLIGVGGAGAAVVVVVVVVGREDEVNAGVALRGGNATALEPPLLWLLEDGPR